MKGSKHVLIAIAVVAFAKPALAAPPEINSAPRGQSAAKSVLPELARNTGVLEGVVRYKADSKRPWSFSRYYVQNSMGGSLSEALVALEGSALAGSAPAPIPTNHTMDQVNYQFVPETMAIRVGDTVRVLNSDDALHNVMTQDGGKPFNVSVVKGKEFSHTFDRAGGLKEPIHLSCAFHGGMRAWIYVFDHPYFKVTERDGKFRFENVPAGEYVLGVIHPAGKLRWTQRIEVKPNATMPVEITLSPDDLVGSKAKDK